jgi:hypothetical protein
MRSGRVLQKIDRFLSVRARVLSHPDDLAVSPGNAI